MNSFENQTVTLNENLPSRLPVVDGQKSSCANAGPDSVTLLLGKEEKPSLVNDFPALLDAPVTKGEPLGTISLYIGDTLYRSWPVTAKTSSKKIDYPYCLRLLAGKLLGM